MSKELAVIQKKFTALKGERYGEADILKRMEEIVERENYLSPAYISVHSKSEKVFLSFNIEKKESESFYSVKDATSALESYLESVKNKVPGWLILRRNDLRARAMLELRNDYGNKVAAIQEEQGKVNRHLAMKDRQFNSMLKGFKRR